MKTFFPCAPHYNIFVDSVLAMEKSDAEEEGSEKIELTIEEGDEVEVVYEMNLYKSLSLVSSVHIIYSHSCVRR